MTMQLHPQPLWSDVGLCERRPPQNENIHMTTNGGCVVVSLF